MEIRLPKLSRVAFGLWCAGALALGATLLGTHLLSLPQPEAGDAVLAHAIDGERGPRERGAWMAVHVLSSECGCSRGILDHLLSGSRPADLAERILLVGADAELQERARAHGIPVRVIAADDLARAHIEAAPLLIVSDPRGRLVYVGGYTDRKQSSAIADIDIIAGVRAGRDIPPLPLFGCAVSDELKLAADPAGLKRWAR